MYFWGKLRLKQVLPLMRGGWIVSIFVSVAVTSLPSHILHITNIVRSYDDWGNVFGLGWLPGSSVKGAREGPVLAVSLLKPHPHPWTPTPSCAVQWWSWWPDLRTVLELGQRGVSMFTQQKMWCLTCFCLQYSSLKFIFIAQPPASSSSFRNGHCPHHTSLPVPNTFHSVICAFAVLVTL